MSHAYEYIFSTQNWSRARSRHPAAPLLDGREASTHEGEDETCKRDDLYHFAACGNEPCIDHAHGCVNRLHHCSTSVRARCSCRAFKSFGGGEGSPSAGGLQEALQEATEGSALEIEMLTRQFEEDQHPNGTAQHTTCRAESQISGVEPCSCPMPTRTVTGRPSFHDITDQMSDASPGQSVSLYITRHLTHGWLQTVQRRLYY